jgi:hypothetical protein
VTLAPPRLRPIDGLRFDNGYARLPDDFRAAAGGPAPT